MEFLKCRKLTLIATLVWGTVIAAPKIEVHGHRGARARFPENTLPAFKYALGLGVDFLELDLAVTKDNVVVVSHDSDINPVICTNDDGTEVAPGQLIRNMTLAEVKKFDCGRKKNPNFPSQTPVSGTRIPTLDEFFIMVKSSGDSHAKTVKFNIETKSDPRQPEQSPPPKEFVKLALKVIKSHGMLSRTVLQSFDHRTLIEARKLQPKILISALTEKEDTGIDYPAIFKNIKDATGKNPDYLSPNGGEISPADIIMAHALKVKVVPWTLNSPQQWGQAIVVGVDGIISDDPEALIAYLKENKLR